MSLCGACQQVVSITDKITCSVNNCSKSYHYLCVKLTKENYSKLFHRAKASWRCPECKLPAKRTDETPIKHTELVDIEDKVGSPVQQLRDSHFYEFEKKISAKLDTQLATQRSMESNIETLKNDFKRLPEVITYVEFMSSKFDELLREVNQLRSESVYLKTENAKLHEAIQTLNSRVAVIEQQSRDSNVEIQCLPEYPREHLISTVIQLAKVVKCPITEKDILVCTRVSKSNPQSDRSKNLIVKLPSPHMRDTLLAAYLNYNKSNPENKLNMADLGIGGNKQQIYVVEHLSPNNRNQAPLNNLLQFNLVKNKNDKVLDLVLSNAPFHISEQIPSLMKIDSHHPPLLISSIYLPVKFLKKSTISRTNFYLAKYDDINHDLSKIDWDAIFQKELDINAVINKFYLIIREIINKHTPKSKSHNQNYPIWYTRQLVLLLKEKEKY
ncbi:unnamed protein product, partial [Leptidea sinapis]